MGLMVFMLAAYILEQVENGVLVGVVCAFCVIRFMASVFLHGKIKKPNRVAPLWVYDK